MSEEIPKKDISMPTKNERTWGMLCHISTFTGMFIPLGNILSPLIIWLIKKDESPFITEINPHRYQNNDPKKDSLILSKPFILDSLFP